ncbi:hypothetical protein WA026_023079 [Henosepilachna vigintioctopunctata]|uniref:Uncharacterized protein n=1 Tax=Henosepilachna vigintioctopunctata TaxID=420089 RepID=A0AAW1UES7_9CUCU
MIDRYIPIMPKTALIVLLLIQGNFIPTGENAELCPKYPLGVTNSVSGIVVGFIITSEKIVNGIFSYFYYLGENTATQLINNHDKLDNIFFKYTNKIQGFFSKLVDGIVEQYQSIYGASSGIFKSIIDSFVKLENSLQTYVYKKTSNLINLITSGKITAKIAEEIRNPVQSTISAINAVKSALFSFFSNVKSTLIGGASSFDGSGYIKEIEDAILTPFKATKDLLQNSTVILKSVVDDSVTKLKDFLHQLEHGSITEKLSASITSPLIAIQETWSLITKWTVSLKSTLSTTLVALVEPLLGSTLTRQFSKLTNLPFDITLGIWNSVKSWSKKLDDFVASVTGGGSLSVRINFVLSHPLDTIKNTWSSTVNATESITRFILGDKATEILEKAFKSPLSALNDIISAITGGGKLSEKLNDLITKPVAFLKGAWNSFIGSIQNITKSIVGEGFSDKIAQLLKAPGQFLNDLISSITGGGTFGEVINNLFTKPFTTIKNIWNSSVSSVKNLVSSIIGDNNFVETITNLFTKPWATVKSIWNSSFASVKNFLISITGDGNLAQQIINVFTKPFDTLKNVWNSSVKFFNDIFSSITGGGSLSVELESLITKPLETVKNIWISTKTAISNFSTKIFGPNITGSISKIINFPITFLNKIISSLPGGGSLTIKITSPITTIKSIWRSTIGSWWSLLVGGSAGGGGGATGGAGGSGGGSVGGSVSVSGSGGFGAAISSLLHAPGKILQESLNAAKNTENSLVGSLKGILKQIPIIGGSFKGGVSVKYGGGTSAGGAGTGGSSQKGEGASSGGGKGASSGGGKGAASGGGEGASSGGGKGAASGGGKGGASGGISWSTKGGISGKSGGSFSTGGSFSVGGSSKSSSSSSRRR